MLYELAFAIHMLGLIGWGGLTTGAYYLLEASGVRERKILLGYRKLVYVEWVSLLAMTLSGLYMWDRLGMPPWVYPAFALSPVIALGEYYHWRLTYVGDMDIFLKRMRILSLFYTLVALFLIYDMVFKPA
ncbi:hypothetical protein HA72_0983 [Metallosphaera sedula]|uniref:Uncharacterized protein n=3 Tax=Metallosphaera TaxID=41980 RepID=A4YFF0_METS5|nr:MULTISPECIES: hypothetical protein [Metallosphaera]ABP95152.1 hypothetical protein Msed_0983 [Metallosphaera sedula DSM 5348]AIM27138.1 hypothetical protein HA72_0983 [Metallosphaera sedula]AKV74043.1 hypothetical protein MsedA_0997 [Metallosphaera sedula]AKV76282.1 hypothetical protein MsedB_0998 [Metallosphaera sedula]AKV78534.1 hypothetical protein MsedC_0997 [Metallosphaera sedula]